MGKRTGGGRFHQRKEGKKKSDFNRKNRHKSVLDKVIIACEGTKTETFYLKSYIRFLAKNSKISAKSLVIAKHKHTDPEGVLEDLLNHKEDNLTYKNFKFKWIVIDRDEARTNSGGHSLANYNSAIKQAKNLKIDVAYSNPSFELWYLLHYKYRDTAIDRNTVIQELKKEKEFCNYEKNNDDIFEKLREHEDKAIKNAARLMKECFGITGTNNPSTNVHKLILCLKGIKGTE